MTETTPDHNPYASPESTEPLSRPNGVRPASGAVTAVAVLNYVMGAINLTCGGLVAGAGLYFFSTFYAISADFEMGMLGMAGGIVVAVGIVIALLGIPSLLAGYGVQRRRQWGRILTIVLAVFSGLIAILGVIQLNPLALIYGGYTISTLVILLKEEHAAEFR